MCQSISNMFRIWRSRATRQNPLAKADRKLTCHFHCAVLLLALSFMTGSYSQSIFQNPGLPADDLYHPGDIDLGALIRLYYPSADNPCGTGLARVGVQVAQAIRWTIEKINKDNTILPNISLGYVLLNDCGREGVALAKATKFLPPSRCLRSGCGTGKTSNATKGPLPMYKVAGVMGPYSSALSVAVSSMLSLYEMPQISWSATSEELSNKARFAYFSRAVPPDQYQSQAMIDILKHYNWTYISTLHAEGSYGVYGIRNIQKLAKAAGICVAYSRELKLDDSVEDYDNVIIQLRKNSKARVVIVFTVAYAAEGLLRAIRRANATEFIFIGSDGFQPKLEAKNPIDGLNALVLNARTSMDAEFNKFYTEELNPWRGKGLNSVDSPWYGEYSPGDVGCEVNAQTSNKSCKAHAKLIDFPQFSLFPNIAIVIDIVKTYSRALHSLIHNVCPEAFRKKHYLESCITGPRVLEFVRKVSFQGSSGYISYDSKGDLLGDYKITQIRGIGGEYFSEVVGDWSRIGEKLILDTDAIFADRRFSNVVSQNEVQSSTDGNESGTLTSGVADEIPKSICATPCGVGEFYIKGELACCWDCKKCRTNERVREDIQGCVVCPNLHWPDQDNFTTCKPIPSSYMQIHEPIAIGILCMGITGVLSVAMIIFIFVKHSDKKVIKGSSRELMTPIIIGLSFAYLTVFLFVAKPTDWSCYANYFGFNLSCTFIFGPLYLKTYRLYRIFQAAERCEQDIRMVNGRSQVVLFILIVIAQVVLTTVAATLVPPGAIEKMPVPIVEHVELLCHLPIQNLLIPLSYNLFLILLCATFGFLTRKLPDNFNESWYIFISVTTTLFVWIAFFPTYCVAFYAYHKAALLALALVLNGAVTTFCLFAPKIYAVYYVDEKKIKVTNWADYEDTINESMANTTSVGTIVFQD